MGCEVSSLKEETVSYDGGSIRRVAFQKSSAWWEAALMLKWLKWNHWVTGQSLDPTVACNEEIKEITGKVKFLVILVVIFFQRLLPPNPICASSLQNGV